MMLELWRPKTTMDKIFDDFFKGTDFDSYYDRTFSPSINVKETKDKVVVKGELAGLKKDDVKVTYENGALIISGEKKCEEVREDEKLHIKECSFGAFRRAIPLHQELIKADSIDAHFKDGILNIEIEKAEQTKPKQIEVKVK